MQREGTVSNGGAAEEDFDLSWDNRWFSKVVIQAEYWMAEIAIPFKTLRFKEGATEWNINSYRQDSYTNERSSWASIPRNFRPYSLAFSGDLRWDTPLEKPGSNISIIPYLSGQANRDFSEKQATQSNFSMWRFSPYPIYLSYTPTTTRPNGLRAGSLFSGYLPEKEPGTGNKTDLLA